MLFILENICEAVYFIVQTCFCNQMASMASVFILICSSGAVAIKKSLIFITADHLYCTIGKGNITMHKI